jgi:hypothetical protein
MWGRKLVGRKMGKQDDALLRFGWLIDKIWFPRSQIGSRFWKHCSCLGYSALPFTEPLFILHKHHIFLIRRPRTNISKTSTRILSCYKQQELWTPRGQQTVTGRALQDGRPLHANPRTSAASNIKIKAIASVAIQIDGAMTETATGKGEQETQTTTDGATTTVIAATATAMTSALLTIAETQAVTVTAGAALNLQETANRAMLLLLLPIRKKTRNPPQQPQPHLPSP